MTFGYSCAIVFGGVYCLEDDMKTNCVATRGDHCLIDDGGGMGHVEYDDGRPVADHPDVKPLPIDSILARGYWKETGVKPSQLPKKREVTIGGKTTVID